MSQNILRKKIKSSHPKPIIGPQLDIGKYLQKAVSLAGLAELDTQIEAKTDGASASTPVQIVDALFDKGLNLLITGAKTPYLGIVSLDPELISSLTDVLTGSLQDPAPATATPRLPTGIDAALCTGFINTVLSEIDAIIADKRPDFIGPCFQVSGQTLEPSAHLFPEIAHVSITLEIDVETGTRGGKFSISVPAGLWGGATSATPCPSPQKPDPQWRAALEKAVKQAPAIFDAVLHRKKMAIGEIMKLKIGDTLEFPASALDLLSLESIKLGKAAPFMIARLGEYQEMRAARISSIGPTLNGPDQQKLLAAKP